MYGLIDLILYLFQNNMEGLMCILIGNKEPKINLFSVFIKDYFIV